jgi:Spy/CpxP family protein refolding chaperone
MSPKVKSWLLLAGIFFVGIMTGIGLTVGLAPRFMHAPGAGQMRNLWMMRLTQKLSLTEDQQTKIKPILADAERKIDELHRDEVGRGSQIIKGANDQISALLTPQQQVELQKMEAERQKLFMGHLHPWTTMGQGAGGSHNPDGMHHHDWNGGAPPPPAGTTNAPTGSPPPQ